MDFPLSIQPSRGHSGRHTGFLHLVPMLAGVLMLGSMLTVAPVEAAAAGTGQVQAAPAKKAAKSPAGKSSARNKASRQAAGSTAVAAAAAALIPAADAGQLSAMQMVMLGTSQCEFNQQIHVSENLQHPGYVDLAYKKKRWLMKPVLSPTGALRLEDVGAEALLIQIRNKSMLMNQRTGQRLVDGCIHPKQQAGMATRP